MYKHDRIDFLCRSTNATEIIDIREVGGIEASHLVVEKTGGGEVVIEGCSTKGGTYATALTVTVPAAGSIRTRLPLDLPQYIRVAAGQTGVVASVRY